MIGSSSGYSHIAKLQSRQLYFSCSNAILLLLVPSLESGSRSLGSKPRAFFHLGDNGVKLRARTQLRTCCFAVPDNRILDTLRRFRIRCATVNPLAPATHDSNYSNPYFLWCRRKDLNLLTPTRGTVLQTVAAIIIRLSGLTSNFFEVKI